MTRPHVSPSQIATWRGCRRKWAYSRVRPRRSTAKAEFGTRTHLQLEGWLRDQIPPDTTTLEGRTAIAGLEHLPPPRSVAVEHEFRFAFEDVDYTGKIDVLGYDPASSTVLVLDHKTTGDFQYALTVERLVYDPQRIIYGTVGASITRAAIVRARWVYYLRATKTQAAQSRPIELLEPADRVAARFVELHRRYGLPIALAHGRAPEEFPRTLSHCGAYGGCPYASECLVGVSAIDRAAATIAHEQEINA